MRPTAVHRLDKRVSGCVVVAKTRQAAAFLSRAFRERDGVRKRYRALVVGRLDLLAFAEEPSQAKSSPALPDGTDVQATEAELHVRSLLDGKPAHSIVRVLGHTRHVQAGWLTTLDLVPLTGRRHQLRRHCQALGVPICGDDLYARADLHNFGGKRSTGLFLQSIAVAIEHPTANGTWVHVELPEAPKFQRQRERAQLGWVYEEQGESNGPS